MIVDRRLQLGQYLVSCIVHSVLNLVRMGVDFFCLVMNVNPIKPTPDAVTVDVWSYKDAKLQSEQLTTIHAEPCCLAVTAVANIPVVRIEQEYGDDRTILTMQDHSTGDSGVIINYLQQDPDQGRLWYYTSLTCFI